jgi:arylsulfatase A-like enzyme
MSAQRQRANLDLLAKLNQDHLANRPDRSDLSARMASYELAYRMQMEVPDLIDLKSEKQSTLDSYGVGNPDTDAFGRKCLLARRLLEKGVRFVQAYAGNWDSHDYIERAHGSLIRSVDKPIAALLRDLKQRGMLNDTLVVWCGEFGRTPDNGKRDGGANYGRDHNSNAMTMWFAGGGTKAGHTIGATDDIGNEAVDCVHHIRDVHCTLLHLLGLDDNKLTYYHAGRHKQLSQFGGQIIPQLLA